MASNLDILINAKNNASRELKAVQKDVAGVESAAGAMGKSLGGLVAFGAAAAGVAAGVGLIAKAAWDLGESAVPVMRLRDSFQQVAQSYGQSGDEMLAAMKKASQGTIAEGDLMLAANRAMLLGVAASADEMSGLIDVAAKRGSAMGLSTAQAFNDIVTGIGRMSPMILDNLGITVDAENTFTAYAAAIGKTAAQLSDAEKKQALLNRIIADSAGLAQPAVDDMARMNVAIVEAKQAMGELFAHTVLVVASGIADQAERLRDALNNRSEAQTEKDFAELGQQITATAEHLQRAVEQMTTAAVSGNADALHEAAGTIGLLRGEILELGNSYNAAAQLMGRPLLDLNELSVGVVAFQQIAPAASDAASGMESAQQAGARMTGVMDGLNASLSGAPAKLAALAQGLGQAAGAAAQAAGMIAGFESQIAGLAASMVGVEGAAAMKSTVSQITGDLGAMQKDWEGIGLSEAEIVALSNTYLSNLNKASTATYSLGKTASGANSEFSSLESTISGIISSATGPVAGVNAEDFLPREDAVNENARRLADIMVNGLTGQDWLGEFAAEVPGIWEEIQNSGDPAGTAAQILKDFQDGLRPELIDRGKAKELAKRAILGDKNAKELAKELAGELSAEMGVSLGQAQAAVESALGVSSGGGGTATSITPVVDTSGMAGQLEPFRTFVITPTLDMSFFDAGPVNEFLGSVIAPQVAPNIRADLANSTAAAFAIVAAMNPLMAITPYIDASTVDASVAVTTLTEKMHVKVVPYIDAYNADTAAATEFLGSVIAPQVAPNVRADLANTSAAAFALVDAMNPLMAITPYISMGGVDLATPTTTMIEGLPVHVTPYIDVDQDTLMAKGMLIADYINAGLRNTSGMSGGDGETQSPFAAAMVNQIAASDVGNVVVTMIAGQIAANMATVETAGKMAGTRFSMGFVNGIENIPAATLAILGRLVAPYVAAASTAAAGQMGASNE